MRKIAVITGARSEYGILKPVLSAIQKHPRLKLQLVVGGMHLSKQFGYTINEIKKDGFRVAATFNTLLTGDTGARMAQSAGTGIIQFTKIFKRLKPDIVVVLGDREEPFAAAVAGLCSDIPVAHIAGGEVATGGHIDEAIRFSITKFSHIHFACTKQSAERIKKLGEEPWRVHRTGSPALDTILHALLPGKDELAKKYKIDFRKPYALVIQHPLTLEFGAPPHEMRMTLGALKELDVASIVVYPNSDTYARRMVSDIKAFEKLPFMHAYKNVPFEDYLGLLKHTSVIVGNSSSAIIEAPSFRVPAVNIGPRQGGRERAGNVIDVDYNKEHIRKAIKKALHDTRFLRKVKHLKSPYGDGHAAKKIVDILDTVKIDEALLHKKITY
ncbi:MAG: UDP-N-acetylglucosamine 2-epimerase (hydrolyzing) [Parcubacteria group bacterium]|nr:UDP-N-acetylglucosamine 2-epimerase (hydrolyzing) [Parcubacteria group bacterium]